MTLVHSDLKTQQTQECVLNILYIEDDEDDLYLIKCALDEDQLKRYRLFHAQNFFQAQHALREYDFDAILLDLSIGRVSGLKTLQQVIDILSLQQQDLPIIILTGHEDETMGEQAIKLGAADYLPKKHASSFNLSRSIRFTIERHILTQKMLDQAKTDELTGLLNRRETIQRCQQFIDQCRRHTMPIAMVMIDLDGFKPINDEYGHGAGDEILRFIGSRLTQHTRATDIVGRLGGDEFLIVFTHFESVTALKLILQKLKAALQEPITLYFESTCLTLEVQCSMGVALFQNTLTLKKTMARADQAMYISKKEFAGNIVFYPSDDPPPEPLIQNDNNSTA